ncbi:hypothetical protein JCM13304A_06980 [Desulfothermus okinawensis JCM 13304]
MYLTWSLLFFTNHKYAIIDGIAISLLILIIFNPYSIFNVGAQLSYLSVIVIIAFFPYFYDKFLLNISSNTLTRYFISIIIISSIINISIFPIISYYFGEVPISFYTNIIFIPVIGLFVFPISFIGGLLSLCDIFHPISIFLFQIADKILSISINWLILLKKFHMLPIIVTIRPGGYILLGFYLILITCYLKLHGYNGKIKILATIGVILIFLPFADNFIHNNQNKVSLEILDVGMGQSLILSYKGKRILVDTGGSSIGRYYFGKNILSPILTYNRFPVIDKIIITKMDQYHMGGLMYLAKRYKITEFYCSELLNNRFKYILKTLKRKRVKINSISTKYTIYLSKDLKIYILNLKDCLNSNTHGLMAYLLFKNNPILVIFPKINKCILSKISDNIKHINAVIVPSYGLKHKYLGKLINKIKTNLLILTGGGYKTSRKYYKYYHNILKEQNIHLYSPSISGCIIVSWDLDNNLNTEIKTFKKTEEFLPWIK